MTYTDTQLKQALAKLLPEQLFFEDRRLFWPQGSSGNPRRMGLNAPRQVLDTELLHVCWLIEQTLSNDEQHQYVGVVGDTVKPTSNTWQRRFLLTTLSWQQRTTALAKVKGVEIV